jgi:predicted aspartyl protease
VGGGGTFPIVYGLVHRLDIGEMKVYNVPIYIRQFRHFIQPTSDDNRMAVDGFLGLSVLTNFRITLDYARREMMLDRPGTLDFLETTPADASVVPFRTTNGGLMSAAVRLGDNSGYHFLIDSGASTTVLSDNVIEKLNWQSKLLPDLKVRVLGAAGTVEEVSLMIVPSFMLHDLEQRNVRTPILNLTAVNETAGFFQAGIIGGSFLRHFRVTFDFQRGRLVMLPQTEAVKRIPPTVEVLPLEKQSED